MVSVRVWLSSEIEVKDIINLLKEETRMIAALIKKLKK